MALRAALLQQPSRSSPAPTTTALRLRRPCCYSGRARHVAPCCGRPRAAAVAAPPPQRGGVDVAALATRAAATAAQVSLVAAALWAADALVLPRLPSGDPRTALVFVSVLALSFGSRKLSLLDASRPTLVSESEAIASRRRPAWMPPPLAFPVVWTTLGVLRAAAATLVVGQTGSMLCVPILTFAAHLCIGDTWNHVNNKLQALGEAVPGVAAVFLSALAATFAFAAAAPDTPAAWLLLPLCAWLSVASLLVFDIWRLNGGADVYPLLPRRGGGGVAA